jgi:citrate synthase
MTLADAPPGVHKGLAGVVADTTAISKVDAESNSLLYRGYPVQDLCAHRGFLDVAHLLWNGELPNATELTGLTEREKALRPIDRSLQSLLLQTPTTCHPMDTLRTAVSWLGSEDAQEDDAQANAAKSLRLLAALPTVVAIDQRRRRGLDPIAPDPELGYSANFFHMTFGEVPEPEVVQAFEVSMILYAEHGTARREVPFAG